MTHDFWAFWLVLIPLAGMGTGLVDRWLKLKERQLDAASDGSAAGATQQTAKIERLEQRMAVLERILTDRSATLSHEIERLRDQPLN